MFGKKKISQAWEDGYWEAVRDILIILHAAYDQHDAFCDVTDCGGPDLDFLLDRIQRSL